MQIWCNCAQFLKKILADVYCYFPTHMVQLFTDPRICELMFHMFSTNMVRLCTDPRICEPTCHFAFLQVWCDCAQILEFVSHVFIFLSTNSLKLPRQTNNTLVHNVYGIVAYSNRCSIFEIFHRDGDGDVDGDDDGDDDGEVTVMLYCNIWILRTDQACRGRHD